MHIAITGSTGTIGSALSASLRAGGHEVIPVSRRPGAGGVAWDPARRQIDVAALHGVDAVVHLAGESIAGGRWTPARRQLLRDSRIPTTHWLADLLAELAPKPSVLISASAIGIYGDRGDAVLAESSSTGTDFLARLAADWEAAADPARQAGLRVVHPRFGIILSPTGGALARMITPFRLGLGGPVGHGQQWMSWVAIDDVVGAISHALHTRSLAGPVNFTAPVPVRNVEFAKALGAALHRPAAIRLPAFALRLAFGEMADQTLLASQRVSSARLIESGFEFKYPTLRGALEQLIESPSG